MSEKPMTELLKRSGIVDKHIAEFRKWRIIGEDGETKSTETMVGDLVKDIAELLEKEPVMKQTLVAPVFTRTPPRIWCVQNGDEPDARYIEFYAVKDELGRLIVDGKTHVIRGDTIFCEDSIHDNFTVLEVEDLYENDKVTAKMITIEKD